MRTYDKPPKMAVATPKKAKPAKKKKRDMKMVETPIDRETDAIGEKRGTAKKERGNAPIHSAV